MEIRSIADWNTLLDSAKAGDVKAQLEVAFNLREGVIINDVELVKIDKHEAFQWIKKGYESGSFEAMLEYADYLTERESGVCATDIDLGMKLYEKCMENGSSTAAYHLGLEYRNKQNFEKAFELYGKSERSDESYPGLTIALSYYYGIGVEKDKLRALEILKTINNGTHTEYEVDEANFLIGEMYLQGEALNQDIAKARHHLELADKDGDHRSAQELLIVIGRTKLLN